MKLTTLQALYMLLALPPVLTACSQDDLGSTGQSQRISMTITMARQDQPHSYCEENSKANLFAAGRGVMQSVPVRGENSK